MMYFILQLIEWGALVGLKNNTKQNKTKTKQNKTKQKQKIKNKTIYKTLQSIAQQSSLSLNQTPGGHWPRKGHGDVRPWRPPFHASPAARKGPISSKRVSSQDPLWRKFGNFSLNSLNFHPNFISQAPKFGNFQLTSTQIWKFSAHKPPNLEFFRSQAPFSEANVSSHAPHFRNPGRTPLPEKKLNAPPPHQTGRHNIDSDSSLVGFMWCGSKIQMRARLQICTTGFFLLSRPNHEN